jgi:hypothetical protein
MKGLGEISTMFETRFITNLSDTQNKRLRLPPGSPGKSAAGREMSRGGDRRGQEGG